MNSVSKLILFWISGEIYECQMPTLPDRTIELLPDVESLMASAN